MARNVNCRFALTGTPMQNEFKELWCLVNWTNMGHLGDSGGYKSYYVTPLQQGQKAHATADEQQLVRGLCCTGTSAGTSIVSMLAWRVLSKRMHSIQIMTHDCDALCRM